MRIGITLLVALGVAAPLRAQTRPVLQPQPVEARRTTAAVTLDGRLDEADWAAAGVLDRFWENYPRSQVTASERTEARFLYDDRYLYVGFRLHLADPSRLRHPFVRRDKVNSTHDYVQVYLDPQGSGQTSTLFRVNARGTKTDGVQDEAKRSETTDPDADWEVRTSLQDDGWSAELRIPLSTLRVSRSGAQTWNVVVTRGVPRDQNTQMATAPWSRDGNCFLCLASRLTFPDLAPKAERLIVLPSAVGTLRRNTGVYGRGTGLDLQPSLDAKWLPYRGAAVDLTINPDFSQVEADSPQLTANQRFAINLPEKRAFFREASDLIGTPLPVLYTRTVTAPDYGLRFTHRSPTLNGTAFLAKDGGRGVIIEPGLLSSSAVVPDFGSKVGFAHLTDRIGTTLLGALVSGKLNDDGSYNATAGVDFGRQSKADRFVGQLVYSWTRDPDRPDLLASWHGQRVSGVAALAQWDHTGALVSTMRYTRYDPGFRSWLGFVPRVGYSDYYGLLSKPFYRSSRILNRIAPYVSYDRLEAIGSPGWEQDAGLGISLSGYKALGVDASWHPVTTVLDRQGRERRTGQLRWSASIQPGPRVPVVSLSGTVGSDVDYATGDVVPVVSLAGQLWLRPGDRLELQGRYTFLQLGDGIGGYRLRETIPEVIATAYFSPSFYVLGDLQLHRTRRTFPSSVDTRSSLASLQFVLEPTLAWRGYFGVRSGDVRPLDLTARGRSTEVYLKVVRRLTL